MYSSPNLNPSTIRGEWKNEERAGWKLSTYNTINGGRSLLLRMSAEPFKKFSLSLFFSDQLFIFIAVSHPRGADLFVGSNFTPTDWR